MEVKKVLLVFGTRPEAIKMAPIIAALRKSIVLRTVICVTAQHREMLDQILGIFSIKPDIDLDIMRPNQDLYSLTATVLEKTGEVLRTEKPDIVLVQGDTTTVMAASLAAFYAKIPVGHVEAGLRTYSMYAPFPEEMNRRLTSVMATYHFAPTELAAKHLMQEQIPKENIFITGNTVVDAVLEVDAKVRQPEYRNQFIRRFPFLDESRRIVLITGHRRENFGDAFRDICLAFHDLATKNPDVDFVYPVHLNPNVRKPVNDIIGSAKLSNFYLIEPLEYLEFVYLMGQAFLIITDSGGVQEEAPSLGKPVLVTREVTERPEGLASGLISLVGSNREMIVKKAMAILAGHNGHNGSLTDNPYGDGSAGKKIVGLIEKLI